MRPAILIDKIKYTDIHAAIETNALKTAAAGARIIGPNEQSFEPWLFDFRALLLQPRWLHRFAEIFLDLYGQQAPFQVCGMESAAISLVAAIVVKSAERGKPINGLYIRKSRKRVGLTKQIEGTPTTDPVILVDDLINSGGTFHKQIKILSDAGLVVTDIFALLRFRDMEAYEEVSGQGGVRVTTIFSLSDFSIPLEQTRAPHTPHDTYEVLWRFSAAEPSHNIVVQKSAPVLDAEHLYFGTDCGILYALSQKNGAIVWEFTVGKHPRGKGILSSPALHDGVLYFGAYDGAVYALDAKNGSVLWTYTEADWVGSSPSLAPKQHTLYIGLEFGLIGKRGGVVALDMHTGKKLWLQKNPALTHCSPLYIEEEGLVICGSNNSTVYAYDATSGEPLWHYAVAGDVKSSFAYDPHTRHVLFGTLGGQLYAVDARTGTPLYSKDLKGGMYSTPLVQGTVVYSTSLDKCIYAIDIPTGRTKWTHETSGRIFSSPTLFQQSLWVGSNDGKLYELDPETGKLLSFFQATEKIVNKIAYNAETKNVFLPTCANEIYCLKKTEE